MHQFLFITLVKSSCLLWSLGAEVLLSCPGWLHITKLSEINYLHWTNKRLRPLNARKLNEQASDFLLDFSSFEKLILWWERVHSRFNRSLGCWCNLSRPNAISLEIQSLISLIPPTHKVIYVVHSVYYLCMYVRTKKNRRQIQYLIDRWRQVWTVWRRSLVQPGVTLSKVLASGTGTRAPSPTCSHQASVLLSYSARNNSKKRKC